MTNIISPHQMPVAKELAKRVGEEHFRYVSTGQPTQQRKKLGWSVGELPAWVIESTPDKLYSGSEISAFVQTCEVLLTNERAVRLMEIRKSRGLKTFYMFERWFKPPFGALRLFHPRYFRMARSLVRLINSGDVHPLPIGIHAARDMARLCGLFAGDLACLFRAPRVAMAAKMPLASFLMPDGGSKTQKRYCLGNMRLWGYFVEPSSDEKDAVSGSGVRPSDASLGLSILWVGRLLKWKRVDTLVRAVLALAAETGGIRLTIVGCGPESDRLMELAGVSGSKSECAVSASEGKGPVIFCGPVPIAQVRDFMREADVYVLPSNGREGWGAVVNEAMGEGCCVIGTHEAGSSETLIQEGINGLLFDAGDADGLADRLRDAMRADVRTRIAEAAVQTMQSIWSPASGAESLLCYVTGMCAAKREGSC